MVRLQARNKQHTTGWNINMSNNGDNDEEKLINSFLNRVDISNSLIITQLNSVDVCAECS